MSDDFRPIPYADPRLPTGPAGFRSYAYPSDYAGVLNGQVRDDGRQLRLEPSPLQSLRIPLALTVALWGGVCLSVWLLEAPRAGDIPFLPRHDPGLFCLAVGATGLIFPCLLNFRRHRRPWIVVDRLQRCIYLPRANRGFEFSEVMRLQMISFAPVGFSMRKLEYRGKPASGELQIVFTENGREETRCIVRLPHPPALKRFAIAFHAVTNVPFARVYPVAGTGEWVIEPFDMAEA